MATADSPDALRSSPPTLTSPGTGSDRGARFRWWLLPLVLAVAIVVAAGAVVTAGSSLWARQSAESETEQLTTVATEVALLLSSLSSDSAGAALHRLAELSTGTLQEEVAARRAEVLQVVDDDEVSVRAEVIASGVERPVAPRGLFGSSAEPATASLLIATRSESRTVLSDEPVERTWRWRVEAVMVDGQPLVASAEVAV